MTREPLNGGVVGANIFERLSDQQENDITNCIEQFCARACDQLALESFFCITAWFPDDANARFNCGTTADAYLIKLKMEDNFVSEHILGHAKCLWGCGYVPIEVIRDGRAAFFVLPRAEVIAGKIETCIIYAE